MNDVSIIIIIIKRISSTPRMIVYVVLPPLSIKIKHIIIIKMTSWSVVILITNRSKMLMRIIGDVQATAIAEDIVAS